MLNKTGINQRNSDMEEIEDGESYGESNSEASEEIIEDDNENINSGWVDAVSKILKQKPKKKTIVLSKAKKVTDVKIDKTKSPGFEIEGADGEIKKADELEDNKEIKDTLEGPSKKKKKEIPKLRVKPNILEKDRERLLQKIATKGVVQLFNAVRLQQKDLNKKLEEAGPLEVKREKVLKNLDKRAFLDVLMGEKSLKVDSNLDKTKSEETKSEKDSTWNVLKEDFLMGAKMKDWDKELDDAIITE